jgi:Cu+-exporting ATPase
MHPQIVRDEPGSCPICGMALEPRTITLEEGPNPELLDMRFRFWVAAAFSLPDFLIAMSVPVAAGVLYPFFDLLVSPIWASAAMTLSSLSVVGNALRLRRVRL